MHRESETNNGYAEGIPVERYPSRRQHEQGENAGGRPCEWCDLGVCRPSCNPAYCQWCEDGGCRSCNYDGGESCCFDGTNFECYDYWDLKACCNGEVYNYVTHGCCNGEIYDRSEKKCCSEQWLCDKNKECCNGSCCDTANCKGCENGSCQPYCYSADCESCDGHGGCPVCGGDANYACCNGECYDTRTQKCCPGGLTGVIGGALNVSDHSPFEDYGYEACLLIEYEFSPYYHTQYDSVDMPDYIDYAFATNMVSATVGFLADAAVPIPEPATMLLLVFGVMLARKRLG